MNFINLADLTTKPSEPVKVMIDETLLIPTEWRALTRKLLRGWKVEITLIDLNDLKINGRAIWIRGASCEIQMDSGSFFERSLEASFKTFLHEIAHIKHTLAQSRDHVIKIFIKMIPDGELQEVLNAEERDLDKFFEHEYVANKQRDLWIEEAEKVVGKDASWEEKARYLCNDRSKRS